MLFDMPMSTSQNYIELYLYRNCFNIPISNSSMSNSTFIEDCLYRTKFKSKRRLYIEIHTYLMKEASQLPHLYFLTPACCLTCLSRLRLCRNLRGQTLHLNGSLSLCTCRNKIIISIITIDISLILSSQNKVKILSVLLNCIIDAYNVFMYCNENALPRTAFETGYDRALMLIIV